MMDHDNPSFQPHSSQEDSASTMPIGSSQEEDPTLKPEQDPPEPKELLVDEQKPPSKKGLWATLATLGILLFGKLKYFLTFFKFGKVLTTGLSMVISIGAYALLYPIPFAIGLVLLILIHEMGHIWVLSRYGVKASAPLFIPFLGAMIALKELPKNVEMEAWVGYGGPLIGGLAAFICLGIGIYGHHHLFLHLAHVGLLINLFNLTPIHPLDGGRITAALSKWFWVIGWLLMLTWFMTGSAHPVLLIILVLGGLKLIEVFITKTESVDPSYYEIAPQTRLKIALAYFALVGILAWFSGWTYEQIAALRF